MTTLVWAGLMVCGGAGAVLRFVVDGSVSRRSSRSLPYCALVVNLAGAVVLDGLVLPTDAALLVGTGIIGSHTAFSTWSSRPQSAWSRSGS